MFSKLLMGDNFVGLKMVKIRFIIVIFTHALQFILLSSAFLVISVQPFVRRLCAFAG